MKKVLAVVLTVAMMVTLFAVSSSAKSGIVSVDDVTVVGASFDDILWTANGGASNPMSAVAAGVPTGGDSLQGWYTNLGANGLGKSKDNVLSNFDGIGIKGWIGFEQEIEAFGYQIDNDEPVIDAYGVFEPDVTEDAVKAAGGQYAKRFLVRVPIAKAGQFSFCVVAKLADGTIVRLDSKKNNSANTVLKINNVDNIQFKAVDKVIDYDECAQYGMSLDMIYFNYMALADDTGDTRHAIDQYAPNGVIDNVAFGGMSIIFTGWTDFQQPVIGFGYAFDDEIVLLPGFTRANEDGLIAGVEGIFGAGNAANTQRFFIEVPLGDLTGDHYICGVAQLQDGTVVKLNSKSVHDRDTSFTVKGNPAPAEPVTRSFNKDTDKQYFDQILINGEPKANGNEAVAALKALVDGSDGSIETIGMYGWFGQVNGEIATVLDKFGYIVDDGEPVFGEFATDTAQDVTDLNGIRYLITVDVTGLKDGKTHKITACAKLATGDIVLFDRENREAIINYQAPRAAAVDTEDNAKTGDMTVAVFAVIAVLAMGAAVVFMKKKAF